MAQEIACTTWPTGYKCFLQVQGLELRHTKVAQGCTILAECGTAELWCRWYPAHLEVGTAGVLELAHFSAQA